MTNNSETYGKVGFEKVKGGDTSNIESAGPPAKGAANSPDQHVRPTQEDELLVEGRRLNSAAL